MEKPIKLVGKDILDSVLNSYSQVFFSTSKVLAILLLFISFFDYGAGIGGLIAVVIANSLAWILGYNKYLLSAGIFGFNALLVGLGVGMYYEPSTHLFLLVAFSSIITFFFTIVFQGILGKYGLPFLSLPFLIGIWIMSLAIGNLSALNISERNIFVYNELYALGGQSFVDFYNLLENNLRSSFLRIYFHSLGAIFFQTHLLAGIVISLGLLIYSRITFVLSFLGFFVAYFYYSIIGYEFDSLGYTFIGFNYILTAIAIGGYFLVPGRVTFMWVIVLLPTVVLITISTQQLFSKFHLSPYSLPFNMVVLMFLYALKFREQRPKYLVETPVQLGSPERNLYLNSGNKKRFPSAFPISASLPFYGEWSVSQGHSGEYTHKGAWRHAWDFIITDRNGNQFKGKGDLHEDYYCFGKIILAPFAGTVIEATNNIPDNTIGDVNTKSNWGNTVVIKHNEYIYSKLSHLKYHSIEVKVGDIVKQGEVVGRCGNSGRSPYPHLHFQFQATPYIGSITLDYPFGFFLLKEASKYSLKTFEFPLKDQIVANPSKNSLLSKALHFIPGQRINVKVEVESKKDKWKKQAGSYNWAVETDVFNSTYIRCEKDGGLAYLYNSGDMHYFTNYTGKKYSALYWFFMSMFKVPFAFLPNSNITDSIQLNMMFGGILKFLQDLVAPICLFLKVDYDLIIKNSGDILSAEEINLSAIITKKIAGRKVKEFNCEVKITSEGTYYLFVVFDEANIKIICQNESD